MVIYFAKTVDSKFVLFDESKENLASFVNEYKDVFGEKPNIGRNAVISPEVFEKKMNGKLWSISDNMNEKATIYISDFKPNFDVVSSDVATTKKVKGKERIIKQNKKKEDGKMETKISDVVVGGGSVEVKAKRHRRSPAEMAAAKGEVNDKVKRNRRSPAEMVAAKGGVKDESKWTSRSPVEMAVARGEVKSPVIPSGIEIETSKSNEIFISRIMILEQAIMFIHSNGSVVYTPTNKAPIYRIDPETGESLLLS